MGGGLLKDLTYWQEHQNLLFLAIVVIAAGQTALIASLLIHRHRLTRFQKKLDERLKFEELVSEISARFVNLHYSQVETEILNALESIRQVVDLDRCHLFAYVP